MTRGRFMLHGTMKFSISVDAPNILPIENTSSPNALMISVESTSLALRKNSLVGNSGVSSLKNIFPSTVGISTSLIPSNVIRHLPY